MDFRLEQVVSFIEIGAESLATFVDGRKNLDHRHQPSARDFANFDTQQRHSARDRADEFDRRYRLRRGYSRLFELPDNVNIRIKALLALFSSDAERGRVHSIIALEQCDVLLRQVKALKKRTSEREEVAPLATS